MEEKTLKIIPNFTSERKNVVIKDGLQEHTHSKRNPNQESPEMENLKKSLFDHSLISDDESKNEKIQGNRILLSSSDYINSSPATSTKILNVTSQEFVDVENTAFDETLQNNNETNAFLHMTGTFSDLDLTNCSAVSNDDTFKSILDEDAAVQMSKLEILGSVRSNGDSSIIETVSSQLDQMEVNVYNEKLSDLSKIPSALVEFPKTVEQKTISSTDSFSDSEVKDSFENISTVHSSKIPDKNINSISENRPKKGEEVNLNPNQSDFESEEHISFHDKVLASSVEEEHNPETERPSSDPEKKSNQVIESQSTQITEFVENSSATANNSNNDSNNDKEIKNSAKKAIASKNFMKYKVVLQKENKDEMKTRVNKPKKIVPVVNSPYFKAGPSKNVERLKQMHKPGSQISTKRRVDISSNEGTPVVNKNIKKRLVLKDANGNKSKRKSRIIFDFVEVIKTDSEEEDEVFEKENEKELEKTEGPAKITKRKLFTPRYEDIEVCPEPVPDRKKYVDRNSSDDQIVDFLPPTIKEIKKHERKRVIKSVEEPIVFKTPIRRRRTPLTSLADLHFEKQSPNIKHSTNKVCYNFLHSLDFMTLENVCHPEALYYRQNYRNKKGELANKLYDLYNENIFNKGLNLVITWNKKLSIPARCNNKQRGQVRSSAIELNEKLLTSPDKLRCTLIHEMCHAATWIFNAENGHGKQWFDWAAKSNAAFKELPKIQIGHCQNNMEYTYTCVSCSATSQANLCAKNVQHIRCSLCHGAIKILKNMKTAGFAVNKDC